MNLFFQALSFRERVFRSQDTRSIFWKNRKTTLTHSTLTRKAGRNSRRRLYRSYWGAFDQLIGKPQDNSGAELAVNGPRATNEAN